MGGKQSEVDGPRPGFTALKAGAGFGDWDNSALGLEIVRWNIAELIWKLSLTVARAEKEHYQGGESYHVFLIL